MVTGNGEHDARITNDVEIRVYGLMRSGNHAIIQWVQNQFRGKVTCFLNNVDHGDHDPYATNKARVLTGVEDDISTDALRRLEKALLIYSYEDRQILEQSGADFVRSIFQQRFEQNRERYFGASRHRFDVLILRDPFNCFASRIALISERGPVGGVSDVDIIASNWKVLAHRALEILRTADPHSLVVSYNVWASDPAYRARLSSALMGSFDDSTMTVTPHFGGGSSFSLDPITVTTFARKWRLLLDPRTVKRVPEFWLRLRGPKQEDYLGRWKLYRCHDEYRRLFRDKEIAELSEKLFGDIPGTRAFLRSLPH